MDNIIKQKIADIEQKFSVKVILAVESGCRAWGFPSLNSDYDVKFIYVNKPDWYISIDQKQETIELPISNYIDMNGWDILKSFKLLSRYDPSLQEWISSPIVYKSSQDEVDTIKRLAKTSFMPESSFNHYLSMAKTKLEYIVDKENIRIKNYMYAIRAIFCCQYILAYTSQPPMKISQLLKHLDSEPLKNEIAKLIDIKFENPEKFEIPRVPLIEAFLSEKLSSLSNNTISNPKKTDTHIYDNTLIDIIKQVWGKDKTDLPL